MLFLDLYTLPNATTGADDILVETISAVPGMAPLLLVFIFFIVFLGGISRQKARSGTADYPMWSVVASLSTFLVALIMSLIPGISIDGTIGISLIIVTVITIFSGVWLFLERRAGEI